MTAGRSGPVLTFLAALALVPAACARQTPERGVDFKRNSAQASPVAASIQSDAFPASALRSQQGQQGLAVTPGTPERGAVRNVTQSMVGSPMVIRTGTASIEVQALEAATQRVRELADRLGGYVGNTTTNTGEGQMRSSTVEIKIPAGRFNEAVSGLAPFGKIESVTIQAEDVGEEFVDLTARTTNAKRLEERLLALLATRTGKLEEVVQVERELARVREEIERLDGRLRYLQSRVAMSTLTVTVHEPASILPPRIGPGVIGEAFRQAWRNGVDLVAALIASLGWLVPLSAVAALVAFIWSRFGRRASAPLPNAPASPGA